MEKISSYLIVSLLALALLSGCPMPPMPEGNGTLVLKITDPGASGIEGLEELTVTISGIEVHTSGGKWITFSEEEQTFDLLQLDGIAELLGEKELEAGNYTQIRLLVKEAKATVNGEEFEVTVPSEKIKLVKSFTIDEGNETELILDFKPESVKETGSGKYHMVPVIKILTPEEFGEQLAYKCQRRANLFQCCVTGTEDCGETAELQCGEGKEAVFNGCRYMEGTCMADVECKGKEINGQECTKEGKTYAVVAEPKLCCEGLTAINPTTPEHNCQPLVGAMLCSDCGNDSCEQWENYCNCPKDCKKPAEKGNGNLIVDITDKPSAAFSALNITITKITVHKSDSNVLDDSNDSDGGEWIDFWEGEKTFDIMQLQGVYDVIGEDELATGHYTQIRLTVSEASVIVEDENTDSNSFTIHPVTVPSDSIKLVHAFWIIEGQTTELVLDFKPESVHTTGNGKYKMTPVIKIIGTGGLKKKGEAVCGNGVCEEDEDSENCPQDCNAVIELCGNGTIDEGENCVTCPEDVECEEGYYCDLNLAECIEISEEECGNGLVDVNETCENCPEDAPCVKGEYCDENAMQCRYVYCGEDNPMEQCALLPENLRHCGNGTCEYGENTNSCPEDCKDENSFTWIEVEPVQCRGNPWEKKWLEEDYSLSEEYPGEEQAIKEYYLETFEVKVYEYKTEHKYDTVCDACSCPRGDVIKLKVLKEDKEKIE